MSQRIYFISGLGADERVFYFLDLPGYERIYVEWPNPYKNEFLSDYAKKIIEKYNISDSAILIGVSFGGMICQEIARIVNCRKVIIISSIKSKSEMAWQLKLVRFSRIYKLIPSRVLKWSNHLTANYYFGVNTDSEKRLLHQVIDDTDSYFLKWAIAAIMKWNYSETQDVFHIHGSNDKIFSINNIRNYCRIEGGGHFMVVNRAFDLSPLILNYLQKT